MNGRDGTKVADPKQMMGMFIAEVFEKAKELQEMLDRDPLLFEQVEQEATSQRAFRLWNRIVLDGTDRKDHANPRAHKTQ